MLLPFTLLFCCVVMVKIPCILFYVCIYKHILKSSVYPFSSFLSEDEDNSLWCILLVCYLKAFVGRS